MNIEATWSAPIDLRLTADGNDLDLDQLENCASVYVIGRRFGDVCVPLYIGQTEKLRHRMKQHFDSRRFTRSLGSFPNGVRFLTWSTFTLKPGQRLWKVMSIVERGLISHSLTEGHQLINKMGTKTFADKVTFFGNRLGRSISGGDMLVPRRRGRNGKLKF